VAVLEFYVRLPDGALRAFAGDYFGVGGGMGIAAIFKNPDAS
jgi:hypothetical protein